jgi:hypothetical protein
MIYDKIFVLCLIRSAHTTKDIYMLKLLQILSGYFAGERPIILDYIFFPSDATAPSGPGPSHYRGFAIALTHHTR